MKLLNKKSSVTLPIEIVNEDKITSKGNLKNKVDVSGEQLEHNINQVYSYWSQRGFPYYPTDKSWRQEKFDTLMKTDYKSLISESGVIKPNLTGLSLAWSYMPHSFGIRCGKMKTPMEIYESEEDFKKGIKKLLTGSFFGIFNITDLMPVSQNLFGEMTETSPQAKFKSESTMRSLLRRYTGTQCVSNFRPTSAAALYYRFTKPNDVVWDMSMGYGGRILGAILADVNYIGTDPATPTYNGLTQIKNDFARSDRFYNLHKLGSEVFQPEKESLDFAFTSPPYFNWEQYSEDEEQSFKQFNSNEQWNNGFLKKTIENVYYGLKKDKVMGLNVANIKSHKTFEDDTVEIAKSVGFKHIDTYKLQLSSQESGAKYEPVFIFKKE